MVEEVFSVLKQVKKGEPIGDQKIVHITKENPKITTVVSLDVAAPALNIHNSNTTLLYLFSCVRLMMMGNKYFKNFLLLDMLPLYLQ